MLLRYVLKLEDYRLLQSLVQYHVLTDSVDLAQQLLEIGSKESEEGENQLYYRPAF